MSSIIVYVSSFILLFILLTVFKYKPRIITIIGILILFVPIINVAGLLMGLIWSIIEVTDNSYSNSILNDKRYVYLRNTKLNHWLFETADESMFYNKK